MRLLKMVIVAIVIVGSSGPLHAQGQPYLFGDLGAVDTDFETTLGFSAGVGYQFNESLATELAYNNYGDGGPFGIGITSTSLGLNWGRQLSGTSYIYSIVGYERLEVDDTVNLGGFTVQLDASSNDVYAGLGVNYEPAQDRVLRVRLTTHDSGEILMLSIGGMFRF